MDNRCDYLSCIEHPDSPVSLLLNEYISTCKIAHVYICITILVQVDEWISGPSIEHNIFVEHCRSTAYVMEQLRSSKVGTGMILCRKWAKLALKVAQGQDLH